MYNNYLLATRWTRSKNYHLPSTLHVGFHWEENRSCQREGNHSILQNQVPSHGWWEKLISSKSTMLLNMIRSSPSLSTHVQAMKIIRRRFTRNITQVKNFRSTLSLNAKKKNVIYLKFRLKIYVKWVQFTVSSQIWNLALEMRDSSPWLRCSELLNFIQLVKLQLLL